MCQGSVTACKPWSSPLGPSCEFCCAYMFRMYCARAHVCVRVCVCVIVVWALEREGPSIGIPNINPQIRKVYRYNWVVYGSKSPADRLVPPINTSYAPHFFDVSALELEC